MDRLKQYEAQLDKELSKFPALNHLEQQTGIPKVYVAVGVSSLVLILVFFNIWASLLTNLLGFVYPAYASIQAVESPGKEDDTQWLTYWVVFGLFNILEYFTNLLLYWVPFYYTIKFFLVLWLTLPQFRGAIHLYHNFIRPVSVQNQQPVSTTLKDQMKRAADEIGESIKSKSSDDVHPHDD